MPCIDTVQGFYFCAAAYQPHTSVYSGFSAVHAIIRSKRQNRLQGFTAAFPLICHIPAHTIQQTHKPTIHHLRHAGAHHSAVVPPPIPEIPPPRRTLYRSTQPPYYNKVYKGAAVRPCYGSIRRRCSITQTMPARRGQRLRLYRVCPAAGTLHPAGQSSGRGAAGGAEPLTATAVSLFGLSPDS